MSLWHRFARFSIVGALGVAVQLTVLGLLVEALHVSYLPATVLAVGAAITHNFAWHAAWTWSDRATSGLAAAGQLARFVLANGSVSLAGNVIVMAALTGGFGVHPIPANATAIAACGLINFWLGHHWVFRSVTMTSASCISDRDASLCRSPAPTRGGLTMRHLTRALLFLLTLTAVAAPAATAGPQDPPQATGRITGVVHYSNSEPVAGQVVLLRRPGTRNMFTQTTDADGTFAFSGLPPGRYEVVATVGHLTFSESVELSAAAMDVADVRLVVGVAPSALSGQEIRVVLTNGRRLEGRLVSLSDTEVNAWDGQAEVTVPLSQVNRIERVPHYARNLGLAGMAIGAIISIAACPTSRDCPDDTPDSNAGVALLAFPIATVAGFAIGAAMNATARRTIWSAPGSGTSLTVRPILTPRQRGVFVSFRW